MLWLRQGCILRVVNRAVLKGWKLTRNFYKLVKIINIFMYS